MPRVPPLLLFRRHGRGPPFRLPVRGADGAVAALVRPPSRRRPILFFPGTHATCASRRSAANSRRTARPPSTHSPSSRTARCAFAYLLPIELIPRGGGYERQLRLGVLKFEAVPVDRGVRPRRSSSMPERRRSSSTSSVSADKVRSAAPRTAAPPPLVLIPAANQPWAPDSAAPASAPPPPPLPSPPPLLLLLLHPRPYVCIGGESAVGVSLMSHAGLDTFPERQQRMQLRPPKEARTHIVRIKTMKKEIREAVRKRKERVDAAKERTEEAARKEATG
ncbi:hypothetical protein EJB05_09799, partial [Eragrostis curvula]